MSTVEGPLTRLILAVAHISTYIRIPCRSDILGVLKPQHRTQGPLSQRLLFA